MSLLKLPLNLATEGRTGYDVTNVTLGALASDEPFAGKKLYYEGFIFYYMSCCMGKPTICIGENKDADQLRSNCEADQRLCFRYTDSTFPLLSKSKISSL